MQAQQIPVVRHLVVRPHLAWSIAIAVAIFVVLRGTSLVHSVGGALLSYDLGSIVYLSTVWWMMYKAAIGRIHQQAALDEDGRTLVLMGVMVAAGLALVGIALQLSAAKTYQGFQRGEHVALAAASVLISWAVTHTMFALHYAHMYYSGPQDQPDKGMSFPETPQPLYGDFLYAAVSIATSGQTADVAITGSAMRFVAMLHCVLSFFFNAAVIVLTINSMAELM